MNNQDELQASLESATNQLLDLGRRWARFGLRVGASALRASVDTLHTTADSLESLGDAVCHHESEATAATPAAEDAEPGQA